MAIKKLFLLLIVLSVLISGCLDSGEDQEQEEQTPEETITPGEMETPVETLNETGTPEVTETSEEMLTPETAGGIEYEQTENVTEKGEEAGTEQPGETGPRTYLVRLKNYVFMPSELEVNTGDLVVWRNYQQDLFILTSEEGLFEDQRLGYGNTFDYTFNETGNYSFNVEGYPKMHMTITVK